MSVFNRISLAGMIKKHFQTFYDDGFFKLHKKRKTPKEDKFLFIFLPILIGIFLVTCELYISNEYLSIILTCLSIFAGLLFGLLSLVFDLAQKNKLKVLDLNKAVSEKKATQKDLINAEIKYRISKELFVNIGFAVFLSIVAIASALLTRLRIEFIINYFEKKDYYPFLRKTYLISTNFLTYFVTTLFILTILMILKRFYLIFENEVNEI